MLCVRECPDWCISIESHTEHDPTAPAYSNARRESTTKVLDTFTIDYAHCMWCGICIEVCPFDALFWSEQPLDAVAQGESTAVGIEGLQAALPMATRADGSAAPAASDPPSGRRKKA